MSRHELQEPVDNSLSELVRHSVEAYAHILRTFAVISPLRNDLLSFGSKYAMINDPFSPRNDFVAPRVSLICLLKITRALGPYSRGHVFQKGLTCVMHLRTTTPQIPLDPCASLKGCISGETLDAWVAKHPPLLHAIFAASIQLETIGSPGAAAEEISNGAFRINFGQI